MRLDNLLQEYNFDAAKTLIENACNKIDKSGLDEFRLTAVREKIYKKSSKLHNAETDYENKITEGWSNFEGKFISLEDKNTILQKRIDELERRLTISTRSSTPTSTIPAQLSSQNLSTSSTDDNIESSSDSNQENSPKQKPKAKRRNYWK